MAAPLWTDKVSIISVQKIANGGIARGTFTLTNYFGGYVFARIGRLSTTAPAVGISILVRRILYDSSNTRDIPHPGALATFQDTLVAANLTTLSGTPSFPTAVCAVTSATGMTGGNVCCIVDSATTPTRAEWCRISKNVTTTVTMDRNFANTAIVSGDTITNLALVLLPIWLDGGPNAGDVEVILDYGLESATSPVVAEVWGQALVSVG